MKNFILLSTPIACLAITLLAQAHHSGTEYDLQHLVETEGKLLEVSWQNPHVRFKLQSADRNGRAVVLDVETNSVSALIRTDIKREDLKVGETIKMFGAPSLRSAQRFMAGSILRENGEELVFYRQIKPRWTTSARGLKTALPEGGTIANPNVTIFHVWASKFGDPELVPSAQMWKKNYPLTKTARKILHAWNPVTDTVAHGCKPKGMPTIMEQPHPLEFVDQGDKILLRMETYDTVRIIHMAESVGLEKQPKTLLGYSTGRWEGRTLVVSTRRISWRNFDEDGVPLGSAATIVERFTPNADGNRLNYTMTVTDPETFTEPVELKAAWVWRPGEQVKPYNCTTGSASEKS